MGYIRAEEILPSEIIKLIQKYVDGENIYIPRRADNRKEWGKTTKTKQILLERNKNIFSDYSDGIRVLDLSKKYYLSEKSIQRIVREMKRIA